MIKSIHIKNVAIIDDVFVNFDNGLNIISGETGTGKSIIIDSINFILGEKASRDFIKKGQDFALVEASMVIDNLQLKKEIIKSGILLKDGNIIDISRTMNSKGKSSLKINDKTFTVSKLKEISDKLIDIHGQNEHHSLLSQSRHIILLDRFCESELNGFKQILFEYIKQYRIIMTKLKELSHGNDTKEYTIDLYEYQVSEIEDANLQIDEDSKLSEVRNKLISAEKSKNLCSQILDLISHSDNSSLEKTERAMDLISVLKNIDEYHSESYEKINTIIELLEQVSKNIGIYLDNLDASDEEIENVESRINLIYNLKRKYGQSIEDILKYAEDTKEKLYMLANSDEEISKLNEEKSVFEKEILNVCRSISEIRKKTAVIIEGRVNKVLLDLGMPKAKIKVDISDKGSFNQNGFDKVEFLICNNDETEFKPLSKIASGGEMSRIMLAFKTVLSTVDNIETFIFDEIDSGISGRTAQQVAEKLSFISRNNQILCITHLPQIASMADYHYLIEKVSSDNHTTTNVVKLKYNEIINELARMIGGATITNITLNAAKEMKEQAIKIKTELGS